MGFTKSTFYRLVSSKPAAHQFILIYTFFRAFRFVYGATSCYWFNPLLSPSIRSCVAHNFTSCNVYPNRMPAASTLFEFNRPYIVHKFIYGHKFCLIFRVMHSWRWQSRRRSVAGAAETLESSRTHRFESRPKGWKMVSWTVRFVCALDLCRLHNILNYSFQLFGHQFMGWIGIFVFFSSVFCVFLFFRKRITYEVWNGIFYFAWKCIVFGCRIYNNKIFVHYNKCMNRKGMTGNAFLWFSQKKNTYGAYE